MVAKNWVTVAGSAELARPLIERAERADGSSPVSDQALLAVAQGQRELLLFTAGAESDAPAEVVAVGILGQGELDLVVDPPARGNGIGTRALRELLSRPGTPAPENGDATAGSRVASQAGTLTAGLLAWAHGENPAASALLRGAGFVPVRSLYRMALDPALLPKGRVDPLAVTLPDGFALRTFEADRVDAPGGRAGGEDPHPTDARAWVAANAAAFASHPEQGKVTLEDFALMRAEPWFDPADLFLLAAPPTPAAQPGADATQAPGPELAGFTWVKTVREGEHVETELYAIGVVPDFAGQGLGRALLDVTLARMAQHHPSRVTLYVDGENERAVRMYEAAGFTIDSRSTQWRGPQVSE